MSKERRGTSLALAWDRVGLADINEPLHLRLGIRTKVYRVPILTTSFQDRFAFDHVEGVGVYSHRYRASVTLAA